MGYRGHIPPGWLARAAGAEAAGPEEVEPEATPRVPDSGCFLAPGKSRILAAGGGALRGWMDQSRGSGGKAVVPGEVLRAWD